MLAFPHRRAIHRTVLVTLAAWVLALTAGFANACLLHDREPVQHGQVKVVDSDVDEAACNESWDAGAIAVTKQAAQDSTHLEPAAIQTIADVPHPASVAVTAQAVDDGVHAHGPPGAIRFLRLRL